MPPMVGPGPGGMMMPQPLGGIGGPIGGGQIGGPVGGVGGMPPRGVGDNMMMMPAPFPPKTPAPMQPQSIKARIGQIIRDKQRFIDMEENQAKRILADILKGLMEENSFASGQ